MLNTKVRNKSEYPGSYIADECKILGDVNIGKETTVFWYAVIRGDNGPIDIGDRTNVQEGCIIHVEPESQVKIGGDVTVGHGAVLHGCTVGDRSLIGMGSVVLEGVKIGNDCLIGAGSLVTANTVIPDGSLAFGNPAKVIRPLREGELASLIESAKGYVEKGKKYFG